MNALSNIRAKGFTLKAVENGLFVDPIDELTGTQRQWLIDHKAQIRQQLLSERWQWFLSLATAHGMHPCVVAAEFPSDQDRLDVVEPDEHDDQILRACMATLCSDVGVKERQQNYDAGLWEPLE